MKSEEFAAARGVPSRESRMLVRAMSFRMRLSSEVRVKVESGCWVADETGWRKAKEW